MGQSLQWSLSRDQLARLSSTPHTSTYLSLFLSGCSPTWVSTMQCLLSSCLAHSAPSLLPVWTSLLSPHLTLDTALASHSYKQIQTLLSMARTTMSKFLHPELAISLAQKTNLAMRRNSSSTDITLGQSIHQYLSSQPLPSSSSRQLLASALTLHSIPPPDSNTPLLSKNPLKMAMLLRHSMHPA